MDASLAPVRGYCIAEPSEARDRIVLDDLVDVHHLESVVKVPSKEGRVELYLIASITPYEHAARGRLDIVFLGVSAHERTEVVARQTDVLEHGLHLGKAQCVRYANVVLDHTKHGPGTPLVRICSDVIVHRACRRQGNAFHFFTAGSLLMSLQLQSHNSMILTKWRR